MPSRMRIFLFHCAVIAPLVAIQMGSSSAQSLNATQTSSSKDWLDEAVIQKHCPFTPINVPPQFWKSPDTLRSLVSVSGNNLAINGTADPDHIVISAGKKPRMVDVTWNGVDLGEYGPISKITLNGNAGDDALIVKSSVVIPANIDGGTGNDCIQGGSGGDQLFGGEGDDVSIAGTGRPAIKSGVGSNRLVIPEPMGTLRYAPGVNEAIINLLKQYYYLRPLATQPVTSKAKPTPIILGVSDLSTADFTQVQQAYVAGQAVLVADGMKADAETLRTLLGHPSSVTQPTGDQSDNAQFSLTYFRQAPRPGSAGYQYHTGTVPILDTTVLEHLTQIFSANEIIVKAPTDSQLQAAVAQSRVSPEAVSSGTPNDLTSVANSYVSDTTGTDPTTGMSSQINNSVWGVRSFQNQADFFYVLQEIDYTEPGTVGPDGLLENFYGQVINIPQISLQTGQTTATDTSPATTTCSESTTSGVNWSITGNAGWNSAQGIDASVSGGVSVVNTQTVTCPQTTITNITQLSSAQTGWTIDKLQALSPTTNSYYNQWIWEIPLKYYASGQTNYGFTTDDWGTYAFQQPNWSDYHALQLNQWIPVPFGTTYSLQPPIVSSVSPSTVAPGDAVTITGSGLYPSTVTGVVIQGTSLPATQYTPVNDTEIQVITPNQSGCHQPIGVQTTQGLSNTSVEVNITGGNC